MLFVNKKVRKRRLNDKNKRENAGEETRTLKGDCPTWTSTMRVYQFRHPGAVHVI